MILDLYDLFCLPGTLVGAGAWNTFTLKILFLIHSKQMWPRTHLLTLLIVFISFPIVRLNQLRHIARNQPSLQMSAWFIEYGLQLPHSCYLQGITISGRLKVLKFSVI